MFEIFEKIQLAAVGQRFPLDRVRNMQ